jgi:integrase
MSEMQLYGSQGERLYLNPAEREAFYRASADAKSHEARTFCRCLYYTGCRISEALELPRNRVDFGEQALTFRSLKKREEKPHWRSVPVPDSFLDELNLVHHLRRPPRGAAPRLWPWHRSTGWRYVQEVMEADGIDLSAPYATAKGLRHGFGVACVLKGIPLPTLKKWMGHASLDTTAIYLQVIGAEERELAGRLWG